MRALLLVLLAAAVVTCGCLPSRSDQPSGPVMEPDTLKDALKIVSFNPGVPAKLKTGSRLNIAVDYRMHSCDGVRIFARPYTNGTKTLGYGAHPSPVYTRGNGRANCWFTFNNPATVDEVRVEMVDEATGKVVARTQLRIKAQWATLSGDALKIVGFRPRVPAKFRTGERLNVTVSYWNRSHGKVRIFARPYTNGAKTTGYGAHPSPLYARGNGKAECWFTFNQPAVVDEVRVEMIDEATGEVVARTRLRIKAKWANP